MTQTIPPAAKPKIISSASLRCSRPLCSSQNTGGTPCNPIQRSDHTRVRRPCHLRDMRSRGRLQHPEEKLPSAGRSLRTQQRAEDQARVEHPFQLRKRSVLRGKILTWSQCQCSTHERHRRTYVSDMATRCTSPVYRGILECSLERR